MNHGLNKEEVRNTSNGDPILPEDIIVDIFSRLPVKTLMRFKCVCKSWCAIISSPSPDFVSRHLQNYYHNPKNDDGLLLIHHANPSASYFNALFPDPTLADFNYQHLDAPVPVSVIFGPCNGIFLLEFEQSTLRALWNPGTKECKVLPRCPPVHFDHPFCGDRCYQSYGFGFDAKSNSFKVVIVRQEHAEYALCSKNAGSILSQYLVYSSCSNSWIQFDLPGRIWVNDNLCYVYLNGVYYWAAYERDNYKNEFLISFDMSSNSFNHVVSSPEPSEERRFINGLLIYRDAIAWVNDTSDYFFHLWVLKHDNNVYSWTKQLAIGPFPEINYPIAYWKSDQFILRHMKEITYWKNDEEHYEFIPKLLLYDPSSASLETSNLGITLSHLHMVLIYKESLVSINGEKYNQGDIPSSWTQGSNFSCPSRR